MRYRDVERYPNAWLETLTHEEIARLAYPFITDRTAADVRRIKELCAKGWQKMTAEERREWLELDLRGAYNAGDLNRVELAVCWLTDILRTYGYTPQLAEIKTDWTDADLPREETMRRYLGNVAAVKAAFCVRPGCPELPEEMRWLDHVGANAIEQTLADIDYLIGNMEAGLWYSDMLFSAIYP